MFYKWRIGWRWWTSLLTYTFQEPREKFKREVCAIMFSYNLTQETDLLTNVITWIFQYDSITERQSMNQKVTIFSRMAKKKRMSQLKLEPMCECLIFNQKYYREVLIELREREKSEFVEEQVLDSTHGQRPSPQCLIYDAFFSEQGHSLDLGPCELSIMVNLPFCWNGL